MFRIQSYFTIGKAYRVKTSRKSDEILRVDDNKQFKQISIQGRQYFPGDQIIALRN